MIKLTLFLITWQAIGMGAFYIDCKFRNCKSSTVIEFCKAGTAGPLGLILTLFNLCFDSDNYWSDYKSPYQATRNHYKLKFYNWIMSFNVIENIYNFFTKNRKI